MHDQESAHDAAERVDRLNELLALIGGEQAAEPVPDPSGGPFAALLDAVARAADAEAGDGLGPGAPPEDPPRAARP